MTKPKRLVLNNKRKRSPSPSPPTIKHKIQDPIQEHSSFHNNTWEWSSPSFTTGKACLKSNNRTHQKPLKPLKELSSSDDELDNESDRACSSDTSLIGIKIVITDTDDTTTDDEEHEEDEKKNENVAAPPSIIRTREQQTKLVATTNNIEKSHSSPPQLVVKSLFKERKGSYHPELSSSDSDSDVDMPSFPSSNTTTKHTKNNSILSDDSIIASTDDEEYEPRRRNKKMKTDESEEEEEFSGDYTSSSGEEYDEESKNSKVEEEYEDSEEDGTEEEHLEDEELLENDLTEEEETTGDEGIDLDSESELSEVETIKPKKTTGKKKRVPISADQLQTSDNGWSYDVTNDQYLLSIGDDTLNSGFVVSSKIFEKLYHHQQIGLKWLAERHLSTTFRGGLLADQMGLGKTIQISALVHGLFLSEKASRVLIICPNSVIGNWQRELTKWTDGCIQGMVVFHQVGGNKSTNKKRVKLVDQFNRFAKLGGSVMLSTYQTISNHVEFLKENFKDDSLLDSIILDEAHKVKNRDAKCSIALSTLSSKSKIALTGTPIMNRLSELYALFSWIFGETLLGSEKEFNSTFATPINHSTKRDATYYEKMLGNMAADSLRETIQPYLMMRDKTSVLSIDNQLYKNEDRESTMAKIGQKNDLVVWCSLTEEQINWYRDYLSSDQVKQVLNKTLNPLVGITVLKQICDHNLMCTGYEDLLKQKKEELKKELMIEKQQQQQQQNENDGGTMDGDFIYDIDGVDAGDDNLDTATTPMNMLRTLDIEDILASSVKAQLVKELVEKSIGDGHKILIFSQYTRMLDIIGRILKSMNLKYNRIDGSVTKYQDRLSLVDSFNEKKNIKCFLLSSGAGGVGLNLTAASRVILVEPNFNPSIDEQAIDRCYRIGQRQNVIVYRLICSSTIEEYVYIRQVSKTTVSRTAVIASNQYRYLRHSDLEKMFTLGDTTQSETCNKFNKIHEKDRRNADGLEEHIEFLKGIPSVVGISDHDVLFCNQADDVNEDQAELEELRRKAQIERVQRIRDLNRNNALLDSRQLMFRLDDMAFSSFPFLGGMDSEMLSVLTQNQPQIQL